MTEPVCGACKSYIDVRLRDAEKRVAAEFAATRVAIDKAEAALGLRLEAMNEFRAQINAERSRYVTRDAMQAHIRVYTAVIMAVMSVVALVFKVAG